MRLVDQVTAASAATRALPAPSAVATDRAGALEAASVAAVRTPPVADAAGAGLDASLRQNRTPMLLTTYERPRRPIPADVPDAPGPVRVPQAPPDADGNGWSDVDIPIDIADALTRAMLRVARPGGVDGSA